MEGVYSNANEKIKKWGWIGSSKPFVFGLSRWHQEIESDAIAELTVLVVCRLSVVPS